MVNRFELCKKLQPYLTQTIFKWRNPFSVVCVPHLNVARTLDYYYRDCFIFPSNHQIEDYFVFHYLHVFVIFSPEWQFHVPLNRFLIKGHLLSSLMKVSYLDNYFILFFFGVHLTSRQVVCKNTSVHSCDSQPGFKRTRHQAKVARFPLPLLSAAYRQWLSGDHREKYLLRPSIMPPFPYASSLFNETLSPPHCANRRFTWAGHGQRPLYDVRAAIFNRSADIFKMKK